MPKQKKSSKLTSEEQAKRFKEAAEKAELTEDEERFKRAFEKVASQRPLKTREPRD